MLCIKFFAYDSFIKYAKTLIREHNMLWSIHTDVDTECKTHITK